MASDIPQPITTSPKTEAHLRATLHRLRQRTVTNVNPSGADTWTGLAGENLVAKNVVYASATGTALKALADAVATSYVIGISTATTLSGVASAIQVYGIVDITGWGLTPGAIQYLSPTTAGLLTETPTTTAGEVVVEVGRALTATKLLLLPESIVLL